jgi:hypothetical protein
MPCPFQLKGPAKMKRVLLVLALLLPVGCFAENEADKSIEDSCGATGLDHLLGQPRSVLEDMTFQRPVRILAPNQPITMDYNPERLNFDTDDEGLIDKVWCG